MDKVDRELLLQIVPTDERLQRLYKEHLKLEKEVQKFERYAPYSASAALHQRELKKQKLKGKEHIMSILHEYREHAG